MNTPWIPRIAVGISSFKELALQSTVFVDKSLLIKEFLENEGQTILLTYPRRWGKSINIDMIKTFLEIEIDEEGNALALNQRENPPLFLGGIVDLGFGETKTLRKLKITNHTSIMKRQGEFPVILLSFKDVSGRNYEDIKNSMILEIQSLYSSHSYLLNSSKLSQENKDSFRKYQKTHINDQELAQSVKLLSKLLYLHYNKKVIILIDEYDTPINSAQIQFSQEDFQDQFKSVFILYRGILSAALKGNPYLEKGLVTGILRIAKANLFSGLNNFVEYGVSDPRFGAYYGFTQEEVDELFTLYKLPQTLAESIKAWYNGYNIGKYQIYNPWSLVKVLNEFQHQESQDIEAIKHSILQNYWEKSGNIEFFNKLFTISLIKRKLDYLISGKPLAFELQKQMSAEDYQVLKYLIEIGDHYEITEASADVLFSYLFLAGYLTVFKEGIGSFVLPNQETKTEMQKKLIQYYRQIYSVETRLFTNVTDQLQKVLDSQNSLEIERAINAFENSLEQLLSAFPKFSKVNTESLMEKSSERVVHGNEDLIHSIMSYIILQLKSISKFGTEVYLGNRRADILITEEVKKKALILEFKYNRGSQEALDQIKERAYADQLIKQLDTFLIGVNVFEDKRIDIQYELVRAH